MPTRTNAVSCPLFSFSAAGWFLEDRNRHTLTKHTNNWHTHTQTYKNHLTHKKNSISLTRTRRCWRKPAKKQACRRVRFPSSKSGHENKPWNNVPLGNCKSATTGNAIAILNSRCKQLLAKVKEAWFLSLYSAHASHMVQVSGYLYMYVYL